MSIHLHAMIGKIAQIFRKSEKLIDPVDLSVLRADIHSHFIPGIDDGAQNMEESLELLREMKALGFNKVITTPHVMSDYYRNTPEIIISGRDDLRKAAEAEGIEIEIECAAEYYLDADLMGKLKPKSYSLLVIIMCFSNCHL